MVMQLSRSLSLGIGMSLLTTFALACGEEPPADECGAPVFQTVAGALALDDGSPAPGISVDGGGRAWATSDRDGRFLLHYQACADDGPVERRQEIRLAGSAVEFTTRVVALDFASELIDLGVIQLREDEPDDRPPGVLAKYEGPAELSILFDEPVDASALQYQVSARARECDHQLAAAATPAWSGNAVTLELVAESCTYRTCPREGDCDDVVAKPTLFEVTLSGLRDLAGNENPDLLQFVVP
jgi:hypothetical protein